MKIALVFDDLIQFGGAEKLLLCVNEIWPDATVYTSTASEKWKKICNEKNIKLHTSFMQRLPLREKLNKFYAPFFLYVMAFESFDFTNYDVVLSISARFSHGVITKPQTKHVCYMNSPGRMIWEPDVYFDNGSHSGRLGKLVKSFVNLPLSKLRMWDYTAAQRVDYFIANSKTPQNRIKKYYGRNSEIIYPFVDLQKLNELAKDTDREEIEKQAYLLVISRLNAWKRLDIAIKACNELCLRLKIIGDGPERNYLESISGDTVEFLGYVSEKDKVKQILGSRAIINTQYEDFGIVPLEAMALGKPVIAYGQGGATETVVDGKTGVFFYDQTPEALVEVLRSFDASIYDRQACISQARKFDKSNFVSELVAYVNSVYLKDKR